MSILFSKPALLVLCAALGYSVATVAMKLTASSQNYLWLTLVFLFLSSAVAVELVILRQMRLSLAYVAILGIESVLVLGYAFWIGEGFSLREAIAAGMVLGGTALLSA